MLPYLGNLSIASNAFKSWGPAHMLHKCGTHQVINLYFNWHLPKHRALSQEKDLLWDLRAQCGQEDSRIPQALHMEHQPCRRTDPGGSASPPRHLAHHCPHMSQLLPSTEHCWIWLPQNEASLSKGKHHKQNRQMEDWEKLFGIYKIDKRQYLEYKRNSCKTNRGFLKLRQEV